MHYSTSVKVFAFVCAIVLGLSSLSNAIPVNSHAAALQFVSIPPIYNGTLAIPSSPSDHLTARQSDWVMDIYWQSTNGDYVPMPLCSTNYGNSGMCSVGYFTSTDLNSATLWMWDNTCKELGFEDSVSYCKEFPYIHSSCV
ncbi:hypothetical protein N431DRAFT_244266 [Stipitochalara longipes BDJ]|nr:hypothetical protein N431DRAFT_244266 [Stipitochalara longipes BDJ]